MATFRRYITSPFDEGDRQRASHCLRLLLDLTCLRRTKDLLHLPRRRDITRELDFSEEERRQYNEMRKVMNRSIREDREKGRGQSKFGIFQALLQLRIFCNHGTFQKRNPWLTRRALDEYASNPFKGSNKIECSLCGRTMSQDQGISEESVIGGNIFALCSACLEENEQGERSHENRVKVAATRRQYDDFNAQGFSTKMANLVSDVQKDLLTTKRQAPAEVSVTPLQTDSITA